VSAKKEKARWLLIVVCKSMFLCSEGNEKYENASHSVFEMPKE
jgi:hypothetical protein